MNNQRMQLKMGMATEAKKCLKPSKEWSVANSTIYCVLYLAGVYCKVRENPNFHQHAV